jgi:uncharacterized membrane protein (UPF0127 family)/uncharacterized integral membrane protein
MVLRLSRVYDFLYKKVVMINEIEIVPRGYERTGFLTDFSVRFRVRAFSESNVQRFRRISVSSVLTNLRNSEFGRFRNRTLKMKNWDKFLVGVLIGLIIVILIVRNIDNDNENEKISSVCIDESCFKVELAISSEDRSRGLMNRENLDLDSGMLFVFPEEGKYPFWMKNTLISLDIIWINSNGEIVYIAEGVKPCYLERCVSIDPGISATYVLEINGGIVSEQSIGVGDYLEFVY